ncbi:MAG: acetyl-CoA decarbonylase/synthase complex subunit delta [Spirochaetales bacterium]|nr:acetyl-CoA decarbonylase/synthase complex subunit delta [Spirochaetales bacterium]
MQLPDINEKAVMPIAQVTIGATKEQGGTREKTVTVGGQTALPFLSFEGDIPNRPVIAGFVSDIVPDWPDVLKNAVGPEITKPAVWADKCVREFGADLICLKLLGADPHGENKDPEACAAVVQDILKAVKLPLIIWGCGDDEKDSHVLAQCSHAAAGENCLIGSAKETNYMTVVALCKADKHKIIAEAPVDINIGKQVNILLQDAGFDLKDIVMYQTSASLGYGFDYVYTILERARIAGLKGDKLMATPQICDVAGEVWRVKEALADEDALPGWGKLADRGPMWEAVCATAYLQAGADILVMAHPKAMELVRKTIDRLMG